MEKGSTPILFSRLFFGHSSLGGSESLHSVLSFGQVGEQSLSGKAGGGGGVITASVMRSKLVMAFSTAPRRVS